MAYRYTFVITNAGVPFVGHAGGANWAVQKRNVDGTACGTAVAPAELDGVNAPGVYYFDWAPQAKEAMVYIDSDALGAAGIPAPERYFHFRVVPDDPGERIRVTDGGAGSGSPWDPAAPEDVAALAVCGAAEVEFTGGIELNTSTPSAGRWRAIGSGTLALNAAGLQNATMAAVVIERASVYSVTGVGWNAGVHVVDGQFGHPSYPQKVATGFRADRCSLLGELRPQAGVVHLLDCWAYPGSAEPEIDMGEAAASTQVSVVGWRGDLKLDNVNDATFRLEVELAGGTLTLGAGCTLGTIIVGGVGRVVNDGTIEPDVSGLVQPRRSVFRVADGGTGEGTPDRPMAPNDVAALQAATGIYDVEFVGVVNLTAGSPTGTWRGIGRGATLVINGATPSNLRVMNAYVTTATGSGSGLEVIDGAFSGYAPAGGAQPLNFRATRSRIGGVTPDGAGDYELIDTYTGPGATNVINMVSGGLKRVQILRHTGPLMVTNLTSAADIMHIDLAGGTLTLAASNTAGTVRVTGHGRVVDLSAGLTLDTVDLVSPPLVADAVWDEPSAEHVTPGSVGIYQFGLGEVMDGGWAAIAGAVWDQLMVNHVIPGSFGLSQRIQEALGGRNSRILSTTYGGTPARPTSATLAIYDSKADADADVNRLDTITLTRTHDALGRPVTNKSVGV